MRKRILLTQGQYAVVDAIDFDYLDAFEWCAAWSHRAQTFYAMRSFKVDGKRHIVLMHREIMGEPKGFDVHHKDHNGLHNWRRNLQVATRSQHTFTARGRKNTTGYRGVHWIKDVRYRYKKWRAVLIHQGVSHFLGNFHTAKEASQAYEDCAKRLFGRFYQPPERGTKWRKKRL